MPTTCSLRSLYNSLREEFVRLNLFDSQSSDPQIIRRAILSTRLFLALFVLSVCILTAYTSLSIRMKTENVLRPTYTEYKRLLKSYSATLECPCAHISIPHGTFVNVVPVFHQVCSSHFVSQLWIDFAFAANTTFIFPMDIRTSLSAMCQLISALCQNARNSLIGAIDQFTNSTLINPMLLSEEILQTHSRATIDSARRTAVSDFMRPFITLRQIAQANGYITGLSVNFVTLRRGGSLSGYAGDINRQPNTYTPHGTTSGCTCNKNGSCPISSGLYLYEVPERLLIYNLNEIIANETLPGFVFDCTPLMMTLASSLECFYNESCLHILLSAYPKTINVSILDNSTASRFMPTTTIEQLINELFIEEILNKTNYASYYNACAPAYCSYTFSSRFDWIYVGAILLALVGGLSAALRFISPYAIDFILFLTRRRSLQVESQSNQAISMASRVRNILLKMKKVIIELNLFNDHSQDLFRIRCGRIATRLYVFLLISAGSVLIMSTSISTQKISQSIQSPPLELYEVLQKQFPDTLQCPCRVVSIPYKELIEVLLTYHQLCGSDFVQPWWYDSFPSKATGASDPTIMVTISSHFRTLAMLCEIANRTIVTVIHRYFSMVFTNAQVMTVELFDSQMNAFIDTVLNSIQAEFLYTMSLIDAILQANQYVSHAGFNIHLEQRNFSQFDPFALQPVRIVSRSRDGKDENGKTCHCVRNTECLVLTQWGIEFGDLIEGLRDSGCSIVDSVLDSILMYWYNDSYFDIFRERFNSAGIAILMNVTLLDPMLSSEFSPNEPTRMIMKKMMVERWNRSVFYKKFYQNCHPAYCLFSYQEKIYIPYIVTTVIGLLGGLNIFFRLLSPVLVKIFFKCINRTDTNNASQASDHQETTDQNHRASFTRYHIRIKLRNSINTLNLFKSAATQDHIIRQERYSTRLYLLLAFISITIVIIYNFLSVETIIQKDPMPSQGDYENLVTSHSDSLQCPCKHISVKHSQFITVNASFHQVCSSDFVKDVWLDFLFGDGKWENYERSDLRVRGTAYFGLLLTLCDTSNTTIQNSAEQFLTQAFVSDKIMPQYEFDAKMAIIRQQFETTTPARFSHTLRLLRDITHSETFISSYFLNWYWWVKLNKTGMIFPTSDVKLDNGCSCGTRSDCTESGGIYRSFSDNQPFAMPGWNVGCSSVETLLRSTLECLYNQTCIDLLVYYATTVYIPYPFAVNVSAMESTLPSRFPINTMIENIVDALFVEEWQINASYPVFYNQCAPIYCSYTLEKHKSFLNMASTVLGLYGGLTVSLRFIAPCLIKLALKIKDRFFTNIVTPTA